ncbi:MAG: hypothetical protein ABWZ52_14320 [Acidimicrobiales bacterium]
MTNGLAARIVQLHAALERAGLPHAFGGAIALGYCVEEPRGTKDIDVNVFVGVDRLDELLAALPAGIEVSDVERLQLSRDAQSRLWWHGTPVDVFLSNVPFHDHAEASRRRVPFVDVPDLPVLSCADLAVFKAFFARPKDALDVAMMITAGAVDRRRLQQTVTAMLGDKERERFFARVDDALAG